MTFPDGSAGEAWINVHANADPFERELGPDIERAARDAEDEADRAGDDLGETISEAMAKRLRKSGPELGKAIEDASSRTLIRTKFGWRDRNTGRFARGIGDDIEGEIEDAFERVGRRGGPLASSIGEAIRDAVGAGFNISGKSPLIALLIPLVGVIAGLIVAALQAVNSLIAALTTLPALLTAIGAQVGVVIIAFQGVGEAIKGAFAAKNATELNEALKNLTPSAQRFVRELLPLRDLFREIQRTVQESFFARFAGTITEIRLALGPILQARLPELAAAMGRFAAVLGNVFASPTFVEFVNRVLPLTVQWLQMFGPDLATFITGLIAMANTSLPFLRDFGALLSGSLAQLGYFFQRVAGDPDFRAWLDRMYETLVSVFGLLQSVLEFTASFLDSLDRAGGKEVLDRLAEAFMMLAFFFSSDVGIEGLRALINLINMSIAGFTGLIIVVFTLLAGLQAFFTFITTDLGPALQDLGAIVVIGLAVTFGFLAQKAGETLAFISSIPGRIIEIVGQIMGWWADLVHRVEASIAEAWHAVVRWFSDIIDEVKALPGKAWGALKELGSTMYERGRALVQGIIDGIRSMFAPLSAAMGGLVGIIADWLPGSPAKIGPLSGEGYSLLRGQRMMQDFAEGIRMEAGNINHTTSEAVSNIAFGPGAVKVTFEGALPTQQQARETGSAVGAGILSQLAARDTRLAIRTL